MIKTAYFFILYLFLKNSDSLFAQNTWEKRYFDYTNLSPYMYSADADLKLDTVNRNYLFVGESHGGLHSIYKLDTNGVLSFRNYYTGIHGSLKNSLFAKDGGVIVSNSEPHSNYGIKTLFKTDSLYNIQWKYQYDIPLSTSRCGLIETSDNKFLLAGTAHYTSYVRPFLIKTDSLGIPLTIKYYTNLFAYARKVIQTKDRQYLIAANEYLGGGAVLLKVDTSGIVLWAKSYLRPKGFINDVFEKDNGNLILVGNTEITFQTSIPKMFLMEVDSTGNTLWIKTYGDSINRFVFNPVSFSYFKPIKIKPINDGGFIIISSIRVGSNPYEDMAMLKTDNIGNVQWERRHGIFNQYEVGIQIIQTPDSGYLAVGVFDDDDPWIPLSGYYFLKTDSLGRIGCDENFDVIVQNNLLPTDSSIIVTDSTLVINIYPAYVHDTTHASADSLPGCIIDGIAANYFEGYELSVYPNPSSGIIHLNLYSLGKKDVFVYDIMGKEIYSRRNSLESNFDIDFSKNEKGIYLFKVSTANESATVKVVVY